MYNLKKQGLALRGQKRVESMKTMVFAGNHKTFSGLRLAAALAKALADNGQDVLLGGYKGKIPGNAGLKTLEISPACKTKSLSALLQKEHVGRVVSVACLPACEAAAASGLPYVYCEPEGFKEEKAVRNKKTLLKKAQKTVLIGNGSGAPDKKTYGSNAVRVQNPAVWTEHGHGEKPACFKKENNVLSAGKLTKSGGFDVLLRAWERLAPLHGTWHLTISGDGTAKTSLKKFIEKNGLSSSVELVPAADCAALMSRADVYVQPSREAQEEDALLDAMACKLPVLAAAVGPAEKLITDGVNGKTVKPADEDALFAALDELMVDWGKRVGLAVEAARMRERRPFEVFSAYFEAE